MNAKKPSPPAIKTEEKAPQQAMPEEINGFKALGLPEPTRYKDWEVKGRCSDF